MKRIIEANGDSSMLQLISFGFFFVIVPSHDLVQGHLFFDRCPIQSVPGFGCNDHILDGFGQFDGGLATGGDSVQEGGDRFFAETSPHHGVRFTVQRQGDQCRKSKR